MNIYHSPRSNCAGEAFLVYVLRQNLAEANYIEENYPINLEYLDNFVDTQSLIHAISREDFLPSDRKENCLKVLRSCPSKLRIALNPNRISFDIVITSDEGVFYWEYHEDQHRNLSSKKDSWVYDAETALPIQVPRYLQRLVRDVWRIENFRPYTIIWEDWFIANSYTFKPQLQKGLYEYSKADKFSLKDFYDRYSNS